MRDFMSFFGELIVMIAVCGVFYSIIPDGSQKKYVQFAISLCILASLIGPMLSVVSSLPEILEDAEFQVEKEEVDLEDDMTHAVIENSRKNIEDSVKTLLFERFGTPKENIKVFLELDTSDLANIEILSIQAEVRSSSLADRIRMKEYLSEQFLDSCEIQITYKE